MPLVRPLCGEAACTEGAAKEGSTPPPKDAAAGKGVAIELDVT
jgi:hypothetical protein